MAYGKIKADTLVYDNSGSDVEVTLASLVTKAETTGETFTGDITLDNQKELRLSEPDSAGSNYVGFEAPDTIASNVMWQLPNADGTAGQALKTDGSSHLSWDTFASTTAPTFSGGIAFEGSTADDYETAFLITDPTADRTVTFTDASGTVALLSSDQTWSGAQRGAISTLTDAATVAVNFDSGNNYKLLMTSGVGNTRELGQPSNQTEGQSGSIFVTQDGTGSRALTYHADWKWAGGTAPTLSTAADAVDRIDYIVAEANKIHAVVTLAVA